MKKLFSLIVFLIIIFSLGFWWVDKNNPYSKNTWVKPFFTTSFDKNGQIILKKTRNLYVFNSPFSKLLMYFQSIFRVETDVYFSERPFKGNEQQIIDQIHNERFNVNTPYTISGGHFPDLYVRNFGVFYSAMLDSRIPSSKSDWETRQRVTLQTIAIDLELLKQTNGQEYTTFTPINSNTFVGTNFNTYPSDSLFAIVYTLNAAINPNFISISLPAKINDFNYSLQTTNAAKNLVSTYKLTLTKAINNYLIYVIDSNTGLIKKDITLSSARDSIKRQSSFYDNVIAWGTAKDAISLGLKINCPNFYLNSNSCDFNKWKENIIKNFWDDRDGLFINDLSSESIKNHEYTGEEFIVTSLNFLDFRNSDDRAKLIKMVNYVQKNNLDKPFPLFYAQKDEVNNLYFFVHYFATSYMGQSIWSHLGQEYIETLILLGNYDPKFLSDAESGLDAYKNNILKYGGYPELYDKNGNIFKTPFYKSMLHTGWVINYEQAKMMLENTTMLNQ